jgi:spore maturation protein CgeB
MRIVMFCHSLMSDWNHGNAHFLRGMATELQSRGHALAIYEPRDAWSVQGLVADQGADALLAFRAMYPRLAPRRYELDDFDLDEALRGAELVLVHEWTAPELVARIGEHHRRHRGYRLLFHDTHHRSVTAPGEIAACDLAGYDGALVYGRAIADAYRAAGWAERVFTWHEAADVRVFHPDPAARRLGDLVWIGNWGDGERADELQEFLIEPVRQLQLRACVFGVRYPEAVIRRLAAAGIQYGGWLANFHVPAVLARFRVTVHIPRRPYRERLAGIPTIRVFEALACSIPLVSAPWDDVEHLFTPGADFLVARDGGEMVEHLAAVLGSGERARTLAEHGRATILARHTCRHRADELEAIVAGLGAEPAVAPVR